MLTLFISEHIWISCRFYKSNASITTAPIADVRPMIAVTIMTLIDMKSNPMTSNCNSKSNAGNENTAMNTRGANRLYIFISIRRLGSRCHI